MRPVPTLGDPPRLGPIPKERVPLSNGIELHAIRRPELPLVDIEFVLPLGAENDAREQAGRFSMIAEMLDEGTATRDALQIAEELDYLGAHLEVQSGWDTINASLHVLVERLPAALDIMGEILCRPGFHGREFVRKQEERVDALYQDEDDAAIVAGKALGFGIFGAAHPYGSPLHGTVAAVSRLTCDTVQQTYADAQRSARPFVVAAGDIKAHELAAMLEDRLGDWPAAAARPPRKQLRPQSAQPTRVLLVDKPGAAQAELRVGHAAPSRATPDYFPLIVLNTVLGGSFTSRLNTILRERMGVTYGASSHFRLRRNGGLFAAGSAVFTESVARSAQVVVEEMTRMAETLVPMEELRRAQSYMALGLPRQFETNEEVAAHVREQILHGLPGNYWEQYVDRVFSVTPEQVREAAARHLQPRSSTIVIVADAAEVRNALEAAQLGQVIDTTVEP